MSKSTKAVFEVGNTYRLGHQGCLPSPSLDKEITVLKIGYRPDGKTRFIRYKYEEVEDCRAIREDNRDYEYFWQGLWSCRA